MMYRAIFICIVLSITFVGCGKKKEEPKKKVKQETIKPKPVVNKDTVKVVEKPKPVVVPPKPDNKYFLIAASFVKEANAIKYKDELKEQGFDSEVIVRSRGVNQDFYKVSYKGFYDKDEAFKELALEKRNSQYEGVWLLIKK
ncbi:SPOR domain-containing protein [Labilibacter marinus]|uniref:SPOR domain-containing protein n=1 Tax=Labilibacter marinus TaxID=1477105 RepID=UPI0009FA07E1|nr:SPOR domain-containing protein [Labilibacter marinus]